MVNCTAAWLLVRASRPVVVPLVLRSSGGMNGEEGGPGGTWGLMFPPVRSTDAEHNPPSTHGRDAQGSSEDGQDDRPQRCG